MVEAITALDKSETFSPGNSVAFNGIFVALAHWQLGHQDEARGWYDKAVEWMDKNGPDDEVLLRFRAEAEELMGIEKEKKHKSQVSSQGSDALESAAAKKPAAAP